MAMHVGNKFTITVHANIPHSINPPKVFLRRIMIDFVLYYIIMGPVIQCEEDPIILTSPNK